MPLNYCTRKTQLQLKYSVSSKARGNSPFEVDKSSEVYPKTCSSCFTPPKLSAPSLGEFTQVCILGCILYNTSASLVIQTHLLHTAQKENRMRLGKTYLARQKQSCITDLPTRNSSEFSRSFCSKKFATQLDLQLNNIYMLYVYIIHKIQTHTYITCIYQVPVHGNLLQHTKTVINSSA